MRTVPAFASRAARALGALALVMTLAVPAAVADEGQPAPGTAASASKAADRQTFGIGPANKNGLDRRTSYVYVAEPGEVISDRVALLNYTFKPVKVRVYASDAFTAPNGAFDVLPAAEKATDLGAWTQLKPRTVTIPARSKAPNAQPRQVVIPFTVRVPRTASAGDHAAGIVASTMTQAATGQAAAGIAVDRRVGTRVYLTVAGPTDPSLSIEGLSVTYAGSANPAQAGQARVTYRVRNTGNVILSAAQSVKVQGLLGNSASSGPLDDLAQVLPGDAVDVSTVVEGVWPTFRVKAVVELDPYAGSADAPQRFPLVSASTSTWAIPWALLIVVLIAATAGYLLVRSRRRPPSVLEPAGEVRDEVLVP